MNIRKSKKNNGITLIALVITIIVMLILVAVIITIAINGGLFEKAGQAVVDTQNAINAEQQLANGRIQIGGVWYDSIDDYLENNPSADQGTVTLTVRHLKSDGTELKQETVETYAKNTGVTVSSLSIEGYETSTIIIKTEKTTEIPTDGMPFESKIPLYTDVVVEIYYDVVSTGTTEEKEISTTPGIQTSTGIVSQVPVNENKTDTKEIIEELKNTMDETIKEEEDDYYLTDIKGEGPLTITFDLSSKAKPGDTATVYHYKNSAWENLGSYTVDNNSTITLTIESFSPFYFSIDTMPTYANASKEEGTSEILAENAAYKSDGYTAIIPKGFRVSEVKAEQAIGTGLVIKDASGNEFVWIPVTSDLENSYSSGTGYSEPTELEGTWPDSTNETKPKYDSQEILNELYGTKYTYSRDFRYVDEYAEMVRCVNKNNGFYIGRYETTIDNGRIGSKYNKIVLTAGTTYTYNSKTYSYRWYGLYYASKNANVTGNGTDVQTAMIYGVLWDKTMDFIRAQKTARKTDYDVDSATSTWHGSSNGHTGVVNSGQANKGTPADVALNIWDLESNAYEWTQEALAFSIFFRPFLAWRWLRRQHVCVSAHHLRSDQHQHRRFV